MVGRGSQWGVGEESKEYQEWLEYEMTVIGVMVLEVKLLALCLACVVVTEDENGGEVLLLKEGRRADKDDIEEEHPLRKRK